MGVESINRGKCLIELRSCRFINNESAVILYFVTFIEENAVERSVDIQDDLKEMTIRPGCRTYLIFN